MLHNSPVRNPVISDDGKLSQKTYTLTEIEEYLTNTSVVNERISNIKDIMIISQLLGQLKEAENRIEYLEDVLTKCEVKR